MKNVPLRISTRPLVGFTNYRYLNNNGVCHTDLFFKFPCGSIRMDV